MAGWVRNLKHSLVIPVVCPFFLLVIPVVCPFFLFVFHGLSLASTPADVSVWEPLIGRLIADGEDGPSIRRIFARAETKFDPKVMSRKLSHRESRLDYSMFLKPKRISTASAFLHGHRALLCRIEEEYGVPKEIKVAILLVETDLGRYLGRYQCFNTLASMATMTEIYYARPWLPPELLLSAERKRLRERLKKNSQWAYEELRALLRYSEQNHIDPLEIKGSVFGAIGLCQFMPSNALRFGVDYDKDGKVDLFSMTDGLASMANYIKSHGWRYGLNRKDQEKIILKYNYSRPYVKTVFDVADRLSKGCE